MRARIVAMFTVPTVEGSAREASRSPAGETAVAGFAENAWVSMARALARVIATSTPFSTETLLSLIASFDKLTRLAKFLRGQRLLHKPDPENVDRRRRISALRTLPKCTSPSAGDTGRTTWTSSRARLRTRSATSPEVCATASARSRSGLAAAIRRGSIW
jgi:hypothetical protein